MFEFTWFKSVICFLQCYPLFPENIIGMSWKASPNFFFSFLAKCVQARPACFWISCHLLGWFLWMAHVKSNNNVWIGRVEASGFHSSWRTVYLCVVHHSTWIMLSNLCFIIGLWLAQQHFSYVFLRFSSLPIFCDGNEIRNESLQPRRK